MLKRGQNIKQSVKKPSSPTKKQVKSAVKSKIVPVIFPSYNTLEKSYNTALMTTTKPPIFYKIPMMTSSIAPLMTSSIAPLMTPTSILKYPPTNLLDQIYDVQNMSYGNGTYIATNANEDSINRLFNGNKYSIDLIPDSMESDGITNMGSGEYNSTTGYYKRNNFITIVDDGSVYKGFFFELSLPLPIYLTDIYLYRERMKSQPLDVVIVGSNSNGVFHFITNATSLHYIISGYEACAKIPVQTTASYDRIRIIVTRVGYIGDDGVFSAIDEISLSEIELYGKQQL